MMKGYTKKVFLEIGTLRCLKEGSKILEHLAISQHSFLDRNVEFWKKNLLKNNLMRISAISQNLSLSELKGWPNIL